MQRGKFRNSSGLNHACTLVWGHGGCTPARLAMTTPPDRSTVRLLVAPLLALTVAAGGCATTKAGRGAPSPAQPAAAAPAPAAAPANAPAAPAAAPAAPAKAGDAAPAAPAKKQALRADLRVPLFDPAFASVPVARVDDEVITMDEIIDAMAMSHEGASEKKTGAGKKDVLSVLDRLIDLRLFVVEARDMKLDELPEVKKTIADYERVTLREMLKKRAVRGVKPDAAEVESKYKDATRQWKVKSAVFALEEDAKQMRKELAAGKAFDDLGKAALEAKTAKAVTPAEFLPPEKMFPQVRKALETARVGDVTDVLRVPSGFVILKVEEVGNVDDAEIRAAAESASVTNRSVATLRQYFESLTKKYAKVDKKAVERLDLEAKKPGIDALAKSTRVLATIRGEKPVTVGDLVQDLQSKYFHGVDSAVKEKRLNQEKWYTFDQFLFRRLLEKEGAEQRFAQDPEYKKEVAGFAREQLFSTFMGRALLPEVKVADAEIRAYYDEHKAEFAYPRFYKLDGLAFDTSPQAQAALDTLRTGNELKWVKEHAEGLADPSRLSYQFAGRTISSKAMPSELAAILAGAKKGDYRLFGGDDGKFYVFQVLENTPPETQSFDDAKKPIKEKLYGQRANATLKEWAAKLRAGHDVEVFITRIEG
jgi:parvulin-like peptidyl-prolyl isomerase